MIAAVIIGGTSLFGGKGTVIGSVIGALIMGMVNNGLILMGLNVDQQLILRGIIVIVAVTFTHGQIRQLRVKIAAQKIKERIHNGKPTTDYRADCQMEPKEKVGQLFYLAFPGKSAQAAQQMIAEYNQAAAILPTITLKPLRRHKT